MMKQLIDLTGKRFGRLTVSGRNTENDMRNGAMWDCICDCGVSKTISSNALRRGATISCGCYKRENTSIVKRKHGLHGVDEYEVWINMLGRCRNKHKKEFKNYGGRGIKVCERWSEFNNFIKDMGKRPSKFHSLDRIDVNGDYDPQNCRWSTKTEQARNKRIYATNKTGVGGVNVKNGKWTARISVDNKRIHLGNFDNFEDAVAARKSAELKYWGKSS